MRLFRIADPAVLWRNFQIENRLRKFSRMKILTISPDPFSTLLHLKMLFRGSGEQYFKSYGSTVQLTRTPDPAVRTTVPYHSVRTK